MIVDIVIKNCKIVNPWGTSPAGIAVNNGKIIAIGNDESLPRARRTIDALGNQVIPGLIDTHVHLGLHHSLKDSARIDTAGAALGGITTIGNYIGGRKFARGSYREKFDEWKEIYEKYAVVDAFFHMFIVSDLQLRELVENARRYCVASFKFIMGYREKELGLVVEESANDGFLYTAFRDIAGLGYPARAMVHAENMDIINKIKPIIEVTGRQDLGAWTDARPDFCEVLDVERAIRIAKVTKTPLYIVHISAAGSVDAVAKAKAEGVDVVGETCPQYLTLTRGAALGPLVKVNPPLRDKESMERLWQGIREGTIECIGTDHCSYTREMKQDIWTAPPGIPGMRYFLPLMLTEGVNKGRITLEKLVEVCCYNNAKKFGIYPQKGVISVGSDADLVVIDRSKKAKLSGTTNHQLSNFCPYEGWEIKGCPLLTMVRGNIVAEDEKLIAQPGLGRYIPICY